MLMDLMNIDTRRITQKQNKHLGIAREKSGCLSPHYETDSVVTVRRRHPFDQVEKAEAPHRRMNQALNN